MLGITNSSQTLTLTGTGFPTTGTPIVHVTGATAGTFTVNSATSATLVLTAVGSSAVGITINGVTNVYTTSPVFSLTAGVAPTLGAATYAVGTTGVGVGASNVPVTWSGTGFFPGAALSFSVTGVTATVTSVTSTSITAKVSVASTVVASTGVGVTLTNTNGGTVTHASDLTVVAAPGGTLSGSAVLAGKTTPITLSSGNFETGMKVVSGNTLLSVGTLVINTTNTSVTIPVTALAMSGTNAIAGSFTITNPDGGTSSYALTINPGPSVTGIYYVPMLISNVQVVISGTGFETGMTATSSNSAYSVILGQVNLAVAPSNVTTAILLVSTTSAATSGTSSNVIFTNPDGGTVTFPLNGGPVPVTTTGTTPVVTGFNNYAMVGTTRVFNMQGSGFMSGIRVVSMKTGVTVRVVGSNGSIVRIAVTVKKGVSAGGVRVMVTNPNGHKTSHVFNVKM